MERDLYICFSTAADAVPIARNPMPSPNEGRIVRGKEARFARLTEGLVELPKQPKSASFFTVLGQDSKQGAEGTNRFRPSPKPRRPERLPNSLPTSAPLWACAWSTW